MGDTGKKTGSRFTVLYADGFLASQKFTGKLKNDLFFGLRFTVPV